MKKLSLKTELEQLRDIDLAARKLVDAVLKNKNSTHHAYRHMGSSEVEAFCALEEALYDSVKGEGIPETFSKKRFPG